MVNSSDSGDKLNEVPVANPQTEQEARNIVYQAYQLIGEDEMDSALSLVRANKVAVGPTEATDEFFTKMKDLNSPDFLHDALIEISDEDIALLKKGKFTKSYFGYKQLDSLFYVDVLDNLDVRNDFIKADKERKINEKITELFSPSDGSNYNLNTLIKHNMNDPDSYEHVETLRTVDGGFLVVRTTYRGNNKFGALVLASITARIDIDSGQILKVLETN